MSVLKRLGCFFLKSHSSTKGLAVLPSEVCKEKHTEPRNEKVWVCARSVSQVTRTMRREKTAVVPHWAEQHPSAHLQKEENQAQKARVKIQGHAGT